MQASPDVQRSAQQEYLYVECTEIFPVILLCVGLDSTTKKSLTFASKYVCIHRTTKLDFLLLLPCGLWWGDRNIQSVCESGCRPTTAHGQHLHARAGAWRWRATLADFWSNIPAALGPLPEDLWYQFLSPVSNMHDCSFFGIQLHRHSMGNPRKAVEYYKRAFEIDSTYTDSLCAILQVGSNASSRILTASQTAGAVSCLGSPKLVVRKRQNGTPP